MPPAGAGFVRVTVPVALAPPTSVEGFKVKDDNVVSAAGLTVRLADLFTPL